jgi:hypothetical protein
VQGTFLIKTISAADIEAEFFKQLIKRRHIMKKKWMTVILIGIIGSYACPAYAGESIQMLPPTPIGTNTDCPSGFQLLLSYSGAATGSGQSGINCVPIQTDAAGDLITSGYIQAGNTNAICTGALVGAIRYNPATAAFEGCNGSSWQSIGGGITMVVGGCQTGWSACPAGYRATSYFSPGTYNCCDKCGNPSWKYTVCSQ